MNSLRVKNLASGAFLLQCTSAVLFYLGGNLLMAAPGIGMAALPEVIQKSDLASGIEWERTDINSWQGKKPVKRDIKTGGAEDFDSYFISAFVQIGESRQTPEEWRRRFNNKFPEYPGLPGGVLMEVYPDKKQTPGESAWIIHFWKSGGQGSVKVWARNNTSYYTRNSLAARDAWNREFAFSECKRLAELVWSRLPEAKPAPPPIQKVPTVTKPAEPIIVVVHGIGLGETRSRGWSAWQSECWGITSNMVEITHNPSDILDSLTWANDVKREFDKILTRKKRENRPVMIIAHSWGSVMSKIVLGGGKIIGMDNKTIVFPPMESGWVDVWITLGSPINSSGRYYYYEKPEVDYGSEKPPQVLYWANFYSTNDVVGINSSTLKTPDLNSHVEVDDEAREWLFAKHRLDPDYRKWTYEKKTNRVDDLTKAQGLDVALAHVAIWYCKPVVSYVRYKYAELMKRAKQ